MSTATADAAAAAAGAAVAVGTSAAGGGGCSSGGGGGDAHTLTDLITHVLEGELRRVVDVHRVHRERQLEAWRLTPRHIEVDVAAELTRTSALRYDEWTKESDRMYGFGWSNDKLREHIQRFMRQKLEMASVVIRRGLDPLTNMRSMQDLFDSAAAWNVAYAEATEELAREQEEAHRAAMMEARAAARRNAGADADVSATSRDDGDGAAPSAAAGAANGGDGGGSRTSAGPPDGVEVPAQSKARKRRARTLLPARPLVDDAIDGLPAEEGDAAPHT